MEGLDTPEARDAVREAMIAQVVDWCDALGSALSRGVLAGDIPARDAQFTAAKLVEAIGVLDGLGWRSEAAATVSLDSSGLHGLGPRAA